MVAGAGDATETGAVVLSMSACDSSLRKVVFQFYRLHSVKSTRTWGACVGAAANTWAKGAGSDVTRKVLAEVGGGCVGCDCAFVKHHTPLTQTGGPCQVTETRGVGFGDQPDQTSRRHPHVPAAATKHCTATERSSELGLLCARTRDHGGITYSPLPSPARRRYKNTASCQEHPCLWTCCEAARNPQSINPASHPPVDGHLPPFDQQGPPTLRQCRSEGKSAKLQAAERKDKTNMGCPPWNPTQGKADVVDSLQASANITICLRGLFCQRPRFRGGGGWEIPHRIGCAFPRLEPAPTQNLTNVFQMDS